MKINRKIMTVTVLLILMSFIYLLFGLNSINYKFFLGKRIPKILVMIILGLGIGSATVVFQTVTMNRILSPGILGMDAIYLFFNSVIIYFFKSSNILIGNPYLFFTASAGFTIFGSFIIYKSIFNKENLDIQRIVLIGMVIGTFLKSLVTLIQMMLDPNEFNIISDLGFASINNSKGELIYFVIPILIIIIIMIIKDSHLLDLLNLGKEQTINLGVDYEKVVKRFLLMVALLISITTSLVGPITFFGIVIVNLSKELLKRYKHIDLIIMSGIIGSLILIFSQFLLDKILDLAMPVGVLISFVGGFYFLFLLIREGKNV